MGTSSIIGMDDNQSSQSTRSGGDWRRIIPGLVISAVSLIIVFYFADLHKLREALLLANIRLIFLVGIIMLCWLAVRGLFWRTLLQDKASYKDVFWTLNEGYLINNILPFRLGEVARAFLLSKKSGLSFWEILSTILIERIMDITYAVGFFFLLLPSVVGASGQRSAAVFMSVVIILMFLSLYLLARNRQWALKVNRSIGERWPFFQRLTGRVVPAFIDGLAVLTDGRRFFWALVWISLDWAIALLQYYVLVKAFVPEVKPLWSSFTLIVAALGIAAPSSPGGVGVFEAAVVGALVLFGVDASVALAAAISAHIVQYSVTGVLGIYALVKDGESLGGLYRRVRGIQPQSEN